MNTQPQRRILIGAQAKYIARNCMKMPVNSVDKQEEIKNRVIGPSGDRVK
jgi:hypothetical protein